MKVKITDKEGKEIKPKKPIIIKTKPLILRAKKGLIIPTDITNEFLEKRPLSYSKGKKFGESPRNYIHSLNNPFVETDDTILGSAIDCLALEPKMFDKRFIVYDNFDKRTDAAKWKWASLMFEAQKNNAKLITKEDLATAEKAVDSLYSVDEAKGFLEAKKNVQKKLQWRDRKTKIPMVGFQDFESDAYDNDWVVDLKKSRNADPLKFNRDVFGDLKYFYQIGAYLDYHHKKLFRFPDFVFIAVESVEPYNVSIMYVESKTAEEAKHEWNSLLQSFRYAIDEQLFHQSYEFFAQTRGYHAVRVPKFYQPKFI